MGKIFELTEKQAEVAGRLMWESDPVVIAGMMAEIDALKGSAEDIITWLSSIYVEAMATADARKARAVSLAEHARVASNAAELLKAKILNTMLVFDIKKISTPLIDLRADQGRESLDIADNADFTLWPDDLVTVVMSSKVDKKAAKEYMLAGGELDGAFIVKKPFLVGR